MLHVGPLARRSHASGRHQVYVPIERLRAKMGSVRGHVRRLGLALDRSILSNMVPRRVGSRNQAARFGLVREDSERICVRGADRLPGAPTRVSALAMAVRDDLFTVRVIWILQSYI